ncbi:MAG TPA: DUF1538 domain-containing protein [Syntrophales bacterium]|nr:DUF1538 domain-containing protein [Syntrophales bacterium]HOX95342.1 DUF1538 domain-containing protein [Syntrophales bacterium]HPI58143.1 DUF1538 domain-containing protein [Syntrophales bacterium]HPN25971.1 DUF1538 domain-containing protein [Syntrophales bacterium]HQM30191.1 DUF1538 domain-containing protein [Syntrophales bacterium]
MLQLIREKFVEVIKAILPLIIAVMVLQFTLVQAPITLFLQFLVGSLMTVAGMVLFFIGIDIGILPMGRIIGSELPQKSSLKVIIAVAFALGFATTVAEPDVLVLSKQVDAISRGAIPGNVVLYVMAAGMAIFVAIAMLRVVYGFSMVYLLAAAYLTVIVLSFFTPAEFIPLAYDAGSVTTGVLTAPVVLAMALGLSSVLAGRSAVSDGFGLLGFASIGPIIAIMIMGILFY